MVNTTRVWPAGTESFQNCVEPVAPAMPVTGTLFDSEGVVFVVAEYVAVSVVPEYAAYPLSITYQVVAAGFVNVLVSLLPLTYGRQSYVVSVGALPALTYMSASPVPPLSVTLRLVWP